MASMGVRKTASTPATTRASVPRITTKRFLMENSMIRSIMAPSGRCAIAGRSCYMPGMLRMESLPAEGPPLAPK